MTSCSRVSSWDPVKWGIIWYQFEMNSVHFVTGIFWWMLFFALIPKEKKFYKFTVDKINSSQTWSTCFHNILYHNHNRLDQTKLWMLHRDYCDPRRSLFLQKFLFYQGNKKLQVEEMHSSLWLSHIYMQITPIINVHFLSKFTIMTSNDDGKHMLDYILIQLLMDCSNSIM